MSSKTHISLKKIEKVAGAAGFEPANVDSKSRCLTEMRIKIAKIICIFCKNFKN